ncbi:hypothetical protein [Streptomyces sp. YGL11-2]|uniref:hypothetical protein n=1 Tax=Streptomyces sp. YGL11-2 TaxID=3414028 RepID=UPI003CED8CDB
MRIAGARGSDTVSRSRHIAELDDAGTPVRLAAAPADPTRILRELRPAQASANNAEPAITPPAEP